MVAAERLLIDQKQSIKSRAYGSLLNKEALRETPICYPCYWDPEKGPLNFEDPYPHQALYNPSFSLTVSAFPFFRFDSLCMEGISQKPKP